MLKLIERRERQSLSILREADKRGEISGHTVRLGRLVDRPDWVGAACSCEESAEARVYGLVLAWVAYHKASVCCAEAAEHYALAS